MTEPIVTYHSTNSKPELAWVAYIDLGAEYLGVRFFAPTEEEAGAKAQKFWAKDQTEREATRARIAAGREKAAAKRAEKTT